MQQWKVKLGRATGPQKSATQCMLLCNHDMTEVWFPYDTCLMRSQSKALAGNRSINQCHIYRRRRNSLTVTTMIQRRLKIVRINRNERSVHNASNFRRLLSTQTTKETYTQRNRLRDLRQENTQSTSGPTIPPLSRTLSPSLHPIHRDTLVPHSGVQPPPPRESFWNSKSHCCVLASFRNTFNHNLW